jgi:hypothetical protein
MDLEAEVELKAQKDRKQHGSEIERTIPKGSSADVGEGI